MLFCFVAGGGDLGVPERGRGGEGGVMGGFDFCTVGVVWCALSVVFYHTSK